MFVLVRRQDLDGTSDRPKVTFIFHLLHNFPHCIRSQDHVAIDVKYICPFCHVDTGVHGKCLTFIEYRVPTHMQGQLLPQAYKDIVRPIAAAVVDQMNFHFL